MADQNFMDLASKTASGITGTDYMMLVNNSEAYKALVNDVAEAILGKLTSKSFSGLETTAKNVIGALNELNSNKINTEQKVITSINNITKSGVYSGSNLWGDRVWTTNFAVMQTDKAGFIIGFNTSDTAHSGLTRIYYAVKSPGAEWTTKIVDV